jgi:transposase-like protein
MSKTTVTSIAFEIPTEAAAWVYLEEMRWPQGAECPKCHGDDVYLIVPTNGQSRRTSSGSMSERRTWNCRKCRRQFSATTGTLMHGTKIPLRTWILVIFEMVSSKNGVAALEIERKYGLCSRTAWFLMHRIREAMSANGGRLFVGNVVMDETYIGGNPINQHASQRVPVKRGRGTSKTPVISLIDAETGEIRSAVVAKVNGRTLRKHIAENVDMAFSTLHTDALSAYMKIGTTMAGHHVVDHKAGQYTTEKSKGTNKAENYFSQLKRSIDGTHHHVSVEHLPRYLGEFDFRYSTCKWTDTERMELLINRLDGKRLSYKRVTEDE